MEEWIGIPMSPPPSQQRPLELILARNLLTSIATPAFLVSREGAMLLYNEAAGALLGVPFEETGRMDPETWIKSFGPFDSHGVPIPIDEMPLTAALRDRRPAHATFTIRSTDGQMHEIAASGMPMVSAEHGASGAIIFFWPLDDNVARDIATGRHEAVQ
jgi:PAS domain-containing protein